MYMGDDIPDEIIEEMDDKASINIQTKGWLKPSKDELYILLKEDSEADIYTVSLVDIDEGTVVMNNSNNKSSTFELNEDTLILSSKKLDYKIIDIERVIPFDLKILQDDDSQLDKVLTSDIIKGLDISLEEIKEKDIYYTDIELKEELLSSLVNIFNAYDKLNTITQLNHYIDDIFNILKSNDSSLKQEIPDWLIPIVDNPIKVYNDIINEDGNEVSENIDDIINLQELSYLKDLILSVWHF